MGLSRFECTPNAQIPLKNRWLQTCLTLSPMNSIQKNNGFKALLMLLNLMEKTCIFNASLIRKIPWTPLKKQWIWSIHCLRILVGGIPNPLKNMSLSVGMIIPNIWGKIKKGSKPPASIYSYCIPLGQLGPALDSHAFGCFMHSHSPDGLEPFVYRGSRHTRVDYFGLHVLLAVYW